MSRDLCPKCGQRLAPNAEVEFRADGLVEHSFCGPDMRVQREPLPRGMGCTGELLIATAVLVMVAMLVGALR